MMICRVFCVVLLILVALCHHFTQAQTTGSRDYGLSGSSVMWLPHPGALFLNPAELARLRQGEVLLSTNRFSTLSSFDAAYFEPFIGTFAAGVANGVAGTQYSFGYARTLFQHHGLGVSVNLLRDGVEKVSVSIGASLHFAQPAKRNSGFHAGLSVVNLPNNNTSPPFDINAGAGYWILPDRIRLQTAWQRQLEKNSFLLGTEADLTSWLSLQAGTRSFENYSGGISLQSSYLTADLSGGNGGISFSLHLRISDPAVEERDKYFDLGQDAYDEGRYVDAREHFRTSLEYDDYFTSARSLVDRSNPLVDSTVNSLLKQGKANQDRGNFAQAV